MRNIISIIKNTKYIGLIVFGMIIFGFLLYFIPFRNHFEALMNDVWWYANYSGSFFNEQLIPYSEFRLEYPPLVLLSFLLPELLSGSISEFVRMFEVQNILFLILMIFLSKKLSEERDIKFSYTLAASLIVFMPIALLRVDLFVSILVIGSLYFYSKYQVQKQKRFGIVAWALLIVGAFTKIYPALLLPIYFLYEIRTKEYKNLGINILVSVAITIPILLFIFHNIDGFRESVLIYHSGRPLQVESTYASILLFIESTTGVISTPIEYNYQSYNIESALSHNLATLSTVLMLGGIISSYIYTFLKYPSTKAKERTTLILLSSTIAVSSFVLINKVFSTQYWLWILPLFAILISFIEVKRKKTILYLILIIISALSIIIYPVIFGGILEKNLAAISVILVRNIMLIYVSIEIFININRRITK